MQLNYIVPKLHNILFILVIFTGCGSEKLLKRDSNLLFENRLFIYDEEESSETVNQLISPKPNTYFLGIPLKLQLYKLSKEFPDMEFKNWLNKKPKRKKRLSSFLSPKQLFQLEKYFIGLNTWMKNNGEKPSLVDSMLITENVKRLNQFYKNKGYFDVETNFEINDLKTKNKEIKYKVEPKEVYIIEDYIDKIKSNELKDLFLNNLNKSYLKSGNPFNIEKVEKERNRLIKLYRNNGVYNLQQNSVQFTAKIDSTGQDKMINIIIEIDPIRKRINDTLQEIVYRKHTIDSIYIYIESLDNTNLNYDFKSFYKGFKINSKEKLKYKNKSITDPIFINSGELYSDNDRENTYRYFNSLRNFKYPSITYEANSDTTLIASIFLTPKERFSLGIDFDISHSNIQNLGMGLGINTGIRNIFKGTEILDFRIKSTLGASRNSAIENDRFFNLFELGADIKIKFPKIISPLPISFEKFIPREMDPNTQITFGTTLQENIGLDKQYFGSSYDYKWSPKKTQNISFKLIDLEFVNNKNIENYFNVYKNSYDRLNEIAINTVNTSQFMNSDGNLTIPDGADSFIEKIQSGGLQLNNQSDLDRVNSIRERKQRLTTNNLILGSSLSLNINSQKSIIDEDFYQLKWKIEWVGNFLNRILEFSSEKNDEGKYTINGVSPSQYVKTEIDYIKHFQTGRDRILAFRFFGGIALPTGNSTNIPFSRSYFAGGANDNRAWKAYKLGPGTNNNRNEFNEANLKISTNLEYRFPLLGPLKGALFIDAGNIWNIADNIKDPEATFDNLSDLSEIAVGSGFGIRYDLDFFIFRFDTAFKTYNPSLDKQNRWLSQFSLKQAVFNIGINYPF